MLKTLETIHAKIETVWSNKEELTFLASRSELLTVAFIVEMHGSSSEKELERRLKECFEEVQELAERYCERRWGCSFLRATRDNDTIDSLRDRIGVLEGDLALVKMCNMND